MAVMDSSGYSDPFVTAVISGQTRKSTVKIKNLNPVWDEHLIFTGVPTKPGLTITLNVWDYDTDNRQELIGQSTLSLGEALDQEGTPMVLRVRRKPRILLRSWNTNRTLKAADREPHTANPANRKHESVDDEKSPLKHNS